MPTLTTLPPFQPPKRNDCLIIPTSTLADYWRATKGGVEWEINGRQNQILHLRSKKLKASVSTLSRVLGGCQVASQSDLDELLKMFGEMLWSVGFGGYDLESPPSIAAVARSLLQPYLHKIWKPTRCLAAKAASSAVKGARIEVYSKFGVGPCVLEEWDIKSCYPRLLSEKIPCGAPIALHTRRFLETDLIELWECDVAVPLGGLGSLPYRDRQQGNIYGPGRWEDTFWGEELRFAMAQGAKVTPRRGWGFAARAPLADLMANLARLSEDERFERVKPAVKRLQVALVGCLAQKMGESTVVHGVPEIGDMPLSLEDSLWIRRSKQEETRYLPWSRHQVASYVWSMGRVRLLEGLLGCDRSLLVQCHTDGFILRREEPQELFAPVLGPNWRRKREWSVMATYECPYRGALFIDAGRIKAPGKRQIMEIDHGDI